MKVREMEIQIDKLGLEKLNVRLGKGGRVHWFLCCQNADNGNLVLYDGHGHAYTLPLSAFLAVRSMESVGVGHIDRDTVR